MIIVSLADKTYKKRLLVSMQQSEKFGYKTRIYDMGGLGFGEPYTIAQDVVDVDVRRRSKLCMAKPAILLDALDNTNETLAYIDADAFIVKNIDEADTSDYDIGVTYKGGERNTYINAGVLFIRQTEAARQFINMWLSRIADVEERLKTVKKHQIGDQIFLNDLVFSYVRKGKLTNTIQDIEGVRVKFFDYRDYNNFSLSRYHANQLHDIPERTKIVHFRNQREAALLEAVKKWEL